MTNCRVFASRLHRDELNAVQYGFKLRNVTVLLAVVVAMAVSAFGDNPPIPFLKIDTGCPETPSDTTFVPDPAGITSTPLVSYIGCSEYQENCTIHYPIYVTRVVGPGTNGEFNGDGTLAAPSFYVQNGVLGEENAYLSVHAYQSDTPSLFGPPQGIMPAQISVNGYESGLSLSLGPKVMSALAFITSVMTDAFPSRWTTSSSPSVLLSGKNQRKATRWLATTTSRL